MAKGFGSKAHVGVPEVAWGRQRLLAAAAWRLSASTSAS
jgi:hypothetical protein